MPLFWKICRLCVLTLILLVLGGYVATGTLFRHRVEKQIETINNSTSDYRLVLRDYSQGFHASSFTLQSVSTTHPLLNLLNAEMQVLHGPWPLDWTLLRRSLRPKMAVARVQLPVAKAVHPRLEKAQFAVEIGLRGQARYRAEIPAFEITLPMKKQPIIFVFSGLQLDAMGRAGTAQLQGTLNSEGFSVTSGTQRFSWGKTDYQFDHDDNFTIPLGTGRMKIDQLSLETGTGQVTVQDSIHRSLMTRADSLLQLSHQATARAVVLGNHSFGPADVRIEAGRLDSRAINAVRENLPRFDLSKKSLVSVLRQLAQHQPYLSVGEISLHSEQGTADMNGQLHLAPWNDQPLPQNRLRLLEGSFGFRCETPLLHQLLSALFELQLAHQATVYNLTDTPQRLEAQARLYASIQLKQWVAQGWLKEDGDRYLSHLVLRRGRILVNGKRVGL